MVEVQDTPNIQDLMAGLAKILQLVVALATVKQKVHRIEQLADKLGESVAKGDLLKADKKYQKILAKVNELLATFNLGSLEELIALLSD